MKDGMALLAYYYVESTIKQLYLWLVSLKN